MLGRVIASMRFLAFGMISLGALLAGALGTAPWHTRRQGPARPVLRLRSGPA
jgi:hypothetical protein